jgi:hypothetical protein
VLILVGVLSVIEGVVALLDDGFYLARPDGFLIALDYVAWGWVHTVSGVAFLVAGIGVLAGSMLARIAGVVLAGLSAVVKLVFVPAQPFWASIVIAFDIIVMYALVVHDE